VLCRTVEDRQGRGKVKEIDDLDVLLQYCEKIFGKVLYITELEAEGNNAMEWSDIELESGEMHVAKRNCEVAEQSLDVIGLEMEWNNLELESGEMYVRQNCEEDTSVFSTQKHN